MKGLKEFDIEIFRLIEGIQHFNYELSSSFFASFEDSFLENGNLIVNVSLTKSERMIIAEFVINGSVELMCDRSLELFKYDLSTSQRLIFKFGDEFMEVSEEVIIIPRDIQKLNLGQYIYEFIGLSIPMKKIHPSLQEDEDLEDENETKLIYQSNDDKKSNKDGSNQEGSTDPRWNALKDLKNKLK